MAIAVYLLTTPAKLLQITVADSHIRMHIGGGLEMCRAAARGGALTPFGFGGNSQESAWKYLTDSNP